MIQIKKILENKDQIIKDLGKRNIDFTYQINNIFNKTVEKNALKTETEALQNKLNNNITFDKETVDILKAIKEKIKINTNIINILEKEIFDILVTIPNIPHEDTPLGKGYDDNKFILQKDYEIDLPENPIPHWELAKKTNIINWDLGNKITQRGFPIYIDKGARLQRAIINFCLDEAGEYGFVEHQVPILVNRDTVYATGQYPDKEGQMYHIEKDDLYLVPTAEVPLTNIYRNVNVKEEDLPILICGYTPCFRREAGTYGEDTKGLNRLHQFDKIELVCITTQEDGYNRLEVMREYIQGLLDKLKLTYRVIQLCGGDIGFGAAKAYDIETYCPIQNKWLEVVTVTNFDTFQANRLNCKYGKKLVHTLNGTGLALPRIMATIMETYQTETGFKIPDVLTKYTGFLEI